MNFYDLGIVLRYIGFAQAFFVIIYLYFFRERKPSFLLFVLFFLTLCASTISYILQSFGLIEVYPRLKYLPIGFYFFTVPLFYLYTKSLLEKIKRKEIILCSLMGIIEFIFMLVLFVLPPETSDAFHRSHYWVFLYFHGYLLNLFSLFFVFLTLFRVKKYHSKYLNFFSNTQKVNLNWIRNTSYILIVIYLFQMLAVLFPIKDKMNIVYFIDGVLTVLFIYWTSFFALKQSHIPDEFETFENSKILNDPKINDFETIVSVLKQSEIYKNSNLTVVELAERVQMHPKKVSHTINQYSGKNFNHFINEFRVNEVKNLLANPNYDNLTIEAIYKEAGFNTKSVFNTVFKNETGETPSSFKKKLKK